MQDLIRSNAVPGERLDEVLSERLKRLGFDPGWPVYGHDDATTSLEIEKVHKALFESTYTKPHLIELQTTPTTDDRDVTELPMLLEYVQLVYVPEAGSKPLSLAECPHYYLRGQLYRNSHDRRAGSVQLHAYIDAYTPEAIRAVYIQVVPRPSGADTTTPLRWAEVAPGELGDQATTG
jgi:hypothetical protein